MRGWYEDSEWDDGDWKVVRCLDYVPSRGRYGVDVWGELGYDNSGKRFPDFDQAYAYAGKQVTKGKTQQARVVDYGE